MLDKTKKKVAIAMGLCLSAVMVAGVVGCSGGGGPSQSDGGTSVAATVNGQKIMEADITAEVEAFRAQSQLESEGVWIQWLNDNGFTPADIREVKIQENVERILLKEVCDERGVTVNAEDVTARVDEIKNIYSNSDFTFEQMLESAGMTEQSYTQQVEEDMLKNALADYVKDNAMNPSEETLLSMANDDMKAHDGMKNYQVIYASSEDDINAAARELAGGASFESVQSKYNENGNLYDGWGTIDAYSDSVIEASAKLSANEVSDPVQAGANQYFIFLYTEVLNVPAAGYTSLDAIPADFKDSAVDSAMDSLAYTEVYSMVNAARQSADIVINEMPAGLSYDVDPSLLTANGVPESTEAESSEASASAASASAESASASAASAESESASAASAEAEEPENAASEAAAESESASAASASAASASASAASAESASAENTEASASSASAEAA